MSAVLEEIFGPIGKLLSIINIEFFDSIWFWIAWKIVIAKKVWISHTSGLGLEQYDPDFGDAAVINLI